MRTETVEYKIYKFSELSEKVQKKVLDEHRDWNVEDFDWWDSVYDMKYDDLKQLGFEDCGIWFSGFSSQGDGACFDCNSFDGEKLIKALEGRIDDKRLKQYKRWVSKLYQADLLDFDIITTNYRYTHKRTRKLTVDMSRGGSGHKRVEALINSFEEDLEELRLSICDDIYEMLEKEYEHLTSDEAVKESLEINEIEFLETGKIYR